MRTIRERNIVIIPSLLMSENDKKKIISDNVFLHADINSLSTSNMTILTKSECDITITYNCDNTKFVKVRGKWNRKTEREKSIGKNLIKTGTNNKKTRGIPLVFFFF